VVLVGGDVGERVKQQDVLQTSMRAGHVSAGMSGPQIRVSGIREYPVCGHVSA
jgi:hypothetical protein